VSTLVAVPAPAVFDDRRTRTSLANTIRSEWTKIWSLRSTMWTLISMFVLTVGFSTLIAWLQTSHLNTLKPSDFATLDPTNQAMAGFAFGQLAIAVLGALVITSEYSTGGIKNTLIAVPNRLRVLTAKGIVFAVIAWIVGTVSAFAAFFIAMSFWSQHGLAAHLSDPGVLRAVFGGGLIALASGMFGFALGALIRHTAGAITAAVGLLFVAPPLTNLLPGGWGHAIQTRFTTNASQRITEVIHTPTQLMPWPGYITMTVEWIVPLLIGAYLIRRRDA
jgi:ABC-2 type transport system permease protein